MQFLLYFIVCYFPRIELFYHPRGFGSNEKRGASSAGNEVCGPWGWGMNGEIAGTATAAQVKSSAVRHVLRLMSGMPLWQQFVDKAKRVPNKTPLKSNRESNGIPLQGQAAGKRKTKEV